MGWTIHSFPSASIPFIQGMIRILIAQHMDAVKAFGEKTP